MTWLRGVEQPLRPARAKLDSSGRCVRKRMVEHVQGPLVLFEDQLEVVVVCSVVDSDSHQTRRSTPEQSHRDAVHLARRELSPGNVFCCFEHREIPSQWGGLGYSTKNCAGGPRSDSRPVRLFAAGRRGLWVPATC